MSWHAELTDRGFRPDGAEYRRNGTTFRPGARWSTLRATKSDNNNPLMGYLACPGLWKAARGAGGEVAPVFEIPEAAFTRGGDDEDGEPVEAARGVCLDWALATAGGESRAAWAPPPLAEVESWVGIGRLTVQHGPWLRQGELIHRPDRLALRLPLVPAVPEDLAPPRRAWLEEVLADAQDRWRMVRVGLVGSAAVAEVDLSGCPAALLEGLFRTGLDCLRWVVAWLVASADFLAAGDPSRALEVRRVRA